MKLTKSLETTWSIGILWSLLNAASVWSLKCYSCSQSDPTVNETRDCASQFQLDCNTDSLPITAMGASSSNKPLCKTIRHKLRENEFSITKECVTLLDHMQAFPGGTQLGCDMEALGSDSSLAYCICDSDLCNKKSIADQYHAFLQNSSLAVRSAPSFLHDSAALDHVIIDHRTSISRAIPLVNGADSLQWSRNPPIRSSGSRNIQSTDAIFAAGQKNRANAAAVAADTFLPPQFPGNNRRTQQEQQQIEPVVIDHQVARSRPTLVAIDTEELPVIQHEDEQEAEEPIFKFTDTNGQQQFRPLVNNVPQQQHENNYTRVSTAAFGNTPVAVVPVTSNLSSNSIQPARFEPEILDEQPSMLDHSTDHGSKEGTEEDFPPQKSSGPIENTKNGSHLMCLVCGEGDLEGDRPECKDIRQMDCTVQYPPGNQLHCLTRDTLLSNGKHAIEKLCLSASAIREEYGENTADACYSTWQGKIKYCICSGDNCNRPSIWDQMQTNPVIDRDRPDTSQRENNTGASFSCFTCSESDLNSEEADCSHQQEMDCGLQYGLVDVYCLTRKTQMPTGLFAVEKRCITADEHRQHYPGTTAVLNACGDAWDGYVKYCTCSQNGCNKGTLAQLQAAYGAVPANNARPLQDNNTKLPTPNNSNNATASFKQQQKEQAKTSQAAELNASSKGQPKPTTITPSTIVITTDDSKLEVFQQIEPEHQNFSATKTTTELSATATTSTPAAGHTTKQEWNNTTLSNESRRTESHPETIPQQKSPSKPVKSAADQLRFSTKLTSAYYITIISLLSACSRLTIR